MKVSKKVFLVVMICLAVGVSLNTAVLALDVFRDVTVKEAGAIIQDKKGNPDLVVLDVRTKEEFDAGHIDAALNLDVKSDKFRDEAGKLDKNRKYLVYCRSGKRSKAAQEILKELGFKEVINMTGGFMDWEKEGLPFKK